MRQTEARLLRGCIEEGCDPRKFHGCCELAN
jgi:hypothetical protein